MVETVVIAEQLTGAPGWLERFPAGEWPVRQEDLDRRIRHEAEERGMRVLSVGEAIRRGPIPLHDISEEGRLATDADGNPVLLAEGAQLCAYVEWEPLTSDGAPPLARERATDV